MRAAASSIASGRPSRRRQIASTVASGASSRPTARARSTKSAAASLGGSGSSRYSRSPDDVQRRPARDEHAEAAATPRGASLTVGAASSRCSKLSSRSRSSRPRRKPARSSGAPIACATSEGTSSGSERPASGTQKTPSRSVPDELGRDLEREAGLPGAAGPGDGEQARAVREQRDELLELVLPPDERARGDRQVRRVERPERREVAVAELVEALGADQVLQAVLAEVADGGVVVEEAAGRLGEDDLAAVAAAAIRAARWTSMPT